MPKSVTQCIFGNFLLNNISGNDLTNVPIWMDYLAQASGNRYAAGDGLAILDAIGMINDRSNLWGFHSAIPSCLPNQQPADAALYDSVLFTPNNSIQGRSPATNPKKNDSSPSEALINMLTFATAERPEARIFVYEGLASMLGYAGHIPNSMADLAPYFSYNSGAYHAWFVHLVDQVNRTDADAQVQLIPVASILAELFTSTLADLPPSAFFADTAPNGRETLFFLAALIVYHVSFAQRPSGVDRLPGVLHHSLSERLPQILDVIELRLAQAGLIESDLSEGAQASTQDSPEADAELPAFYADPFYLGYFVMGPEETEVTGVDLTAEPVLTAVIADLPQQITPVPQHTEGVEPKYAVQAVKSFETPEGGVFLCHVEVDNYALLRIDDEDVLDTRDFPDEDALSFEIEFDPGPHVLEVLHLENGATTLLSVGLTPLGKAEGETEAA